MSTTFNSQMDYVTKNFNDDSKVLYTGITYSLEGAPQDVPLVLTADYDDIPAGSVIMKVSRRTTRTIYTDSSVMDTGNYTFVCYLLRRNDSVHKQVIDGEEIEEEGRFRLLSEYKYAWNRKDIWGDKKEIIVDDFLDLAVLNRHRVCIQYNFPKVKSGEVRFYVEKDSEDTIKLHLSTLTERGFVTHTFTTFMIESFGSRIIPVSSLNAERMYMLLDKLYKKY